ncbi:MAG: hypothetical protein U5J98_01250 [Halobacteriales archaeon]|nr:hypothetical protein [Halobacteriales archaeon]
MNSSRSSSLAALLLVLVLAVGAAGAATVSQADAPSEAQVGSDVQATFVLTELFQNPSLEQWSLEGDTELRNVTWTVQVDNQAGSQIAQETYDGQTFEHPVDLDNGDNEIRVTLTGTVPPVENYTYSPAEQFRFAELSQARQGGTSDVIESYETHHYTEDSRTARQAIDSAQAAIEAAGGHQEAQRTLNSAIDAYESEPPNFELATDLANQAEDTATKAQSSQNRNRLILMAVGALVLIGLVVGAVIYWRRSRTHSRL